MNDDVIAGPYTAGEIGAPIAYQFLQAKVNPTDPDVPLDLTAGPWEARFEFRNIFAPAGVEGTPDLDTDTATATYVWRENDMATAGVYVGDLWIGDGTNRFASVRIVWQVRAAVNAAPNI